MLAIEVDAAVIGDSAFSVGIVTIRAAVFGDLDGKLIVLCDALDDVIHATGINLPANLCERAFLPVGEFKAHRIIGRFGGSGSHGSGDKSAEVIADANVIEGSGHSLF